MTKESILKIAERFAAEVQTAPDADHHEVLRRCILSMGEDVARTVFLAAHAEAAKTPPEKCSEVLELLEAGAVIVGCDFANQVRKSVHPDLPDDAGMTDIERFAASAYWSALQRLVQTAEAGGSA